MPEDGEDAKDTVVNVADRAAVKRAVTASAIGNVTEWYDFGVYGYLAATISKVFFSGLPPAMGIIATFGLFAVSFLVRPLGGLILGPLADRVGRKRVLSLTVMMMAVGTCCLGLVPSYASIGIAAPILALLARLVQGISTGGEYGNAMTFIAEYAPDRRRGYLGSWLEFGTLTGYILGATTATVLTTSLTEEQLLSWGWRIPFLIALPLGMIGLYLRLRLEETPAFGNLAEGRSPAKLTSTASEYRVIFTKYWRALLLCVGLVLAWNVTNYLLTSYVPTFLTETLPEHGERGAGQTMSQILQISVLLLLMVVVTFVGRLSDRVGRRPVLFAGCAALVVLSLPAVLLLREGGTMATFFGLALIGLTLVCFSGTMPSTLPALFPTEIRSGGLSIAFNVSVSLFGGTTATVLSALIAGTGELNMPAYYLMGAGAIGLLCVVFLPESAGRPLAGSAPTVTSDSPEGRRSAIRRRD